MPDQPSTMMPVPLTGPWKGVVTDLPSGFDAAAWDVAQNVVFRKGRIQSRPPLTALMAAPPDGRPIRAVYSFLDVLNNWHTIVLTDTTPYALTYSGGALVYNQLLISNSIPNLSGTGLPYGLQEMDQKVFFCNGSQPLLYADGSNTVTVAGDVPGACLYLTENSGSLIGVNWTIPAPGIADSAAKPFYVQISSAGNPLEWTPSISTSAQIINLIERGGIPTGCTTQGAYTYVWRQYGANVLWPTGNAAALFYNEPFTWSNPGWGSYYPYALALWNQTAIMVTHNGEVLAFNGAAGPTAQGFQPLADGKIKLQLSQDIQNIAGDQVYGFVTDQLGPGFDFQAYVLSLPGLNKLWVLNLVDMTWSWFTSNGKYATAFGNIKVQ